MTEVRGHDRLLSLLAQQRDAVADPHILRPCLDVVHFLHQEDRPFAFAGLWERWQAGDGSEIHTAAIITTHPNPFMAAIHDRMPVILPPDAYPLWLDPSPQAPASLQSLLVPYPADAMEAYPVSPLVNSPGNDRPELLIQE